MVAGGRRNDGPAALHMCVVIHYTVVRVMIKTATLLHRYVVIYYTVLRVLIVVRVIKGS